MLARQKPVHVQDLRCYVLARRATPRQKSSCRKTSCPLRRSSVRDRTRGPKRVTDFSGGLRVGEEWPLHLSNCSAVPRRGATSVHHRACVRAELPEETVPGNVVNVWLRQNGRWVLENCRRGLHRCRGVLRRETGVWTNRSTRRSDEGYLTCHSNHEPWLG